MEKIHIGGHSMKNIPISSRFQYHKSLTKSVEIFNRNMRWNAFFKLYGEDKKYENDEKKETYGFKTGRAPPYVKEIEAFEKDLYNLIANIEFKQNKSQFQHKLDKEIDTMKEVKGVIVAADKSRNYYKIDKQNYNKLLMENITMDYQKADEKEIEEVNHEGARIAKNLELDERMECYTKPDSYITVKDHKDGFPGRIKCRLINPAKTDIGRVSKVILQKINEEIRHETKADQWRCTQTVINWFKSLHNKDNLHFIKFDIVEFYPSISKELLEEALKFAEEYCLINTEEKNIIRHARKTFLFMNEQPWRKKGPDKNHDVAMGSFDGAELCELIGLYLLSKLTKHKGPFKPGEVGLYRDDGLAAVKGSGTQIENIKKKLTSIFKQAGLKITAEANITRTEYLDVVFDLKKATFRPYRKPQDNPVYIHTKSNHPPNIIRQIPSMISQRLSMLSSSEAIFYEECAPYQKALEDSGYKEVLKYLAPQPQRKKARRRKILWFNPPFNLEVKTNVAAKFLKLIDKHFPKKSPLGRYYNRCTVKVSYRTMPNMKAQIDKHNRKILNIKPTIGRTCNCRKTALPCPLEGKCLTSSIVYQADVSSNSNIPNMTYYGLTGDEFKTRFNNHNSDFRKEEKKNSTQLSKHIWKLKDSKIPYNIKWSIKAKAIAYKPGAKHCDLCLVEKTVIALANQKTTLNSRSEILGKCRHKNKFCLKNF